MTDTYSTMYGLADPLGFELGMTEEEKRIQREKFLEQAIAAEEAQTGQRSPIRDQITPPAPTVQEEESTPSPNESDPLAEAYKATETSRYTVAGATAPLARAPWEAAAAVVRKLGTDPLEDPAITEARGITSPESVKIREAAAKQLSKQGAGAEATIRRLTGTTEEPTDFLPIQGYRLGEAIQPAGKFTVPLTVATYLTNLFNRTPVESVEQIINPIGTAHAANPEWLQFGQYASPLDRPIPTTQGNIPAVSPTVTVQTQGGPKEVSAQDYATLGGIVLASAGMMYGPKTFMRMKGMFGGPGPLRPVADALPGVSAISTPRDLLAASHDVNKPLINIAYRAGMPDPTVDRLKDVFRIQTRGGAVAIGDAAVLGGHARTPTFQFQVDTPVSTLHQLETPQASRYMQLWDQDNEIKVQTTQRQGRQMRQPNWQPPPGPVTVQGMTMADTIAEITALEQGPMGPQLRQFRTAYQRNLRETRRFEADGEYATMRDTPVSTTSLAPEENNARWLNANRPDEVPRPGGRVTGEPVAPSPAALSLAEDMRDRIRFRVENEAKGMYIDELNRTRPGLTRQITREQWEANPQWNDKTVTFFRRGVKEYYLTDPFIAQVMRMDPYFITSGAQLGFYQTKRLLEMGATGKFAPWFAITNAIRSHAIGKLVAPTLFEGAKAPGILRSTYALPQQLVPQLANAISQSIEHGSAGYLRGIFGNGNMQALSTYLAHVYDSSLYNQLRSVGASKPSVLSQQLQSRNAINTTISNINRTIDNAPPAIRESLQLARGTLRAFNAFVDAVHNAPTFAFASKNYARVPLNKLAIEMRNMTGDPRIGGQYYAGRSPRFGGMGGEPFMLQGLGRVSHTLALGARGVGALAEIGRGYVPWFNVTMQGMKGIGAAYLHNPMAFTGRTWLYTLLPAAGAYFYNRAIGNDPYGRSYSDYQMRRRSDYKQTMNYYIGIPGLPAERGIEIPRFHELAFAARMMEHAMDHIMGSSVFNQTEDFKRAAQSIFNIAVEPPMPPIAGVLLGHYGIQASGGVFGGESFKRRTDPFDEAGGLPSNMELIARALGGGIADVAGAGAAAFTQTPDGIGKAFANFFKEAGSRAVSKTPILRDVLGILPPAAGNTNVTQELFDYQRVFKQLDQYYKGDKSNWAIGEKPRSKLGEAMAEQRLGERPPTESAGLDPRAPVNPLYKEFIKDLHTKFFTDTPYLQRGVPKDGYVDENGNIFKGDGTPALDRWGNPKTAESTGAIGFQSLWNRYAIATRNIQRINKVNIGNDVTWQDQLEDKPAMLAYLKKNNIDDTNRIEVKNFFERQRQDAARVILKTIKSVEYEWTQRAQAQGLLPPGKEFKFDMLHPYKEGFTSEYGGRDLALEDFNLGQMPNP